MPLNKAQLKKGISDLMTDMQSREENAIDEFSTRLSNAIEDYVKGLQITYTAGLVSPQGPVTGSLNYTLS